MSRSTVAHLSTLVMHAIRLAWPDSRRKHLARAANVSYRTAKRLVLGELSARQRDHVLALLDARLGEMIEEAQGIREQLRRERATSAQESGGGSGLRPGADGRGASAARSSAGEMGAG